MNEKSMEEMRMRLMEQELKKLCELAKDFQLVITIDLVPQHPLAMGNYVMSPLVRRARAMAEVAK